MDRKYFGEKIRKARESIGYSHNELIKRLGYIVSVEELEAAESGSHEVNEDALVILADFFLTDLYLNGNVSVLEISSVYNFIQDLDLYQYKLVYRDDLDIEELECVLDLFILLERKPSTVVEDIERELEIKRQFEFLDDFDIKVFSRRIEKIIHIEDEHDQVQWSYDIYLIKDSSRYEIMTLRDGRNYINAFDFYGFVTGKR